MPYEFRKKLDISEALMQLQVISQEILRTGAVDSEVNLINNIKTELLNNKITPEEAVEQGNKIKNKRQDYH